MNAIVLVWIKYIFKDEVNATDTVALTHVVKATDTINPD